MFHFTSGVTRSDLDQHLAEVGKFTAAGGEGLNSVNAVIANRICSYRSAGEDVICNQNMRYK